MAEPERRTRSTGARIAVGLALTFVLASAAAVAVPWLQRPPGPARTTAAATAVSPAASPAAAPAASPSLFAVVCRAGPRDRDHCRRYGEDLLRRAPLTAAQRAEAEARADEMEAALPDGDEEIRCAGPDQPCSMRRTPPDLARVREALAGHSGVLVRVARSDDPAPRGSILIVLPVGAACVLIHHDGDPQRTVGGRLPDGRCSG